MSEIVYILSFILLLSAILSLLKPKQEKKIKIIHKCPCFKMVENGLMSRICIYTGSFGLMYSVLYVGFFGIYDKRLFFIFFISCAILYFSWILKKD